MLYTGIDTHKVQMQNFALFPKNHVDLFLREWVKPADNIVVPNSADVPGYTFCDPCTSWIGSDGLWCVTVAAKVSGPMVNASTLVCRSKDFRRGEMMPHHCTSHVPPSWSSAQPVPCGGAWHGRGAARLRRYVPQGHVPLVLPVQPVGRNVAASFGTQDNMHRHKEA